MANVDEIAGQIISEYIQLRRSNDVVFVTYGQLAKLIGRDGQHRLLGAPLDRVRGLCAERGLPDIAAVVVDQESLSAGRMMPSRKALEKYHGWSGLRQEQARVMAFDWRSLR